VASDEVVVSVVVLGAEVAGIVSEPETSVDSAELDPVLEASVAVDPTTVTEASVAVPELASELPALEPPTPPAAPVVSVALVVVVSVSVTVLSPLLVAETGVAEV
jgi:hypothetical protein